MITDKINFKQPKYMLPAILYPLLLITGYLVFDIFDTEAAEKPSELQTTEFLNPELPQAQIQSDGIGGKYESMVKSYGKIQDYSAVENIDRGNEEEDKEGYDSKYSKDDLALLDMEAAQRTEELEKLQRSQEMQEKLRQSAEKGKNLMTDSTNLQPLSEAERLARSKQREQGALAELQKAFAEARLNGQKNTEGVPDMAENTDNAGNGHTAMKGKIEVNGIGDNTTSSTVVKLVKKPSDYFHTLAENESEPKLIKAIIDEDIKAVDGSRVRLRLLDDVEIGELVVSKGAYLYATMTGFGSQRVKGNVKSLMVDDELLKVDLSIYDTDGLEGLYVPSSTFRETSKDVASSALGSNVNMNNGTGGNSFTQWGMQAVQNAYQQTSNAISKSVKKNKAKLKYGTFVYLVNGKEKKSTER
ncbi:conjugative transposon protein TraM [Bacteroides sp. BFG-638]|uniref:conjugative transposon protein TraM n=1 Tax=unclassified Bacteroides TaxID=2646097 RepID=UPI0021659F35|nr:MULTISPECIES: conjugative transposon protein TraM [unclassified Bacteroides]MCS2947044.1 conjugative transposon protein TraM [Bacteroides sp. BFG-638]MCS3310673.1 conjugative transposon protein TraM [Bacteroides sp. BFG-637]